jgi:uncharacterized Zn-binding protein involved in type VI secretion
MPGPLLHVNATGTCPHGMGQLTIVSSNTRVMVSGMPVATASDLGTIAGCAFTVPVGKPQPCVEVKWLTPATRVMVNGSPALLLPGPHLCVSADQIPAGPPVIAGCQSRAVGT